MAAGLYRSIIGELADAGSVRILVLMLQNEPLLDPELGQRVREARVALGPRCRIGVVTNGSLLDAARAGELAAGGLDFLEVSLDALRPMNKSITGIFFGAELALHSDRVHPMVARHIADVGSGALRVAIDRRYPLSEAARAHAEMEGRQTTGKLLLDPAA